jgi:hypothetical protein
MIVDAVRQEDVVQLFEVRIIIVDEEGLIAVCSGYVLANPASSE